MDATVNIASNQEEFVISRIFDAPRKMVWEAWTNPQHVAHWWGPNGFTTTIKKMDFRVGGVWKHVMYGLDGTDYPNSSVFREIVKPERIVLSHGGRREGGPGAHFMATWTFEALGKQTLRDHAPGVRFPGRARTRRHGIRRHRGRETDPGQTGSVPRKIGDRSGQPGREAEMSGTRPAG